MKSAFSADNQANNGLIAVSKSDSTFAVIGATTVTSITKPASARFVAFAMSGNFWADVNNGSLAVPSATDTTAKTYEFNPQGWMLDDSVTSINIIASAAISGTVSFYK